MFNVVILCICSTKYDIMPSLSNTYSVSFHFKFTQEKVLFKIAFLQSDLSRALICFEIYSIRSDSDRHSAFSHAHTERSETRIPCSKARRQDSQTLQQPSTSCFSFPSQYLSTERQVMPRPQTRQKGSAGLLPCPRILPTCFRARISEREVEEHANIAGFRSVSLSLLRPLAKSAQLYCP